VHSVKSRLPMEDPLALLSRGVVKLYSIWVSLFYPFASIGRDLSIHFTCLLSRKRSHRISLGSSITLRAHVWLNPAQIDRGEPLIVLDDNCAIGFNSIISANNHIHIERDVLIAQSVLIQDHNHDYEDPTLSIRDQGITEGGRIRIGQGSWIGHGAAIICPKGQLTIGHNCVIGANSVVTRSIPPYSVVFGIPARIIRQFDPVKGVWVIGSTQSSGVEDGKSAL
jgi:acetyltransferase-like isoleucine patch superfamily enzyme